MHLKVESARTYNRNLTKVWSAINPTAGTGIAEAIKAAFAATAATALLRNGAPTRGLQIRPRYLRMVNTVAPASGTAVHCRIAIDDGVTRFTSGGSSLTPRNRDMGSGVASQATCRFGALVTAAATANVRYVSQSSPSVVIPVVGDEIIFAFGNRTVAAELAASNLGGTVARRIVTDVGPVTIGPGSEMLVHTWYPSNAATPASWEVEFVWEESLR